MHAVGPISGVRDPPFDPHRPICGLAVVLPLWEVCALPTDLLQLVSRSLSRPAYTMSAVAVGRLTFLF